MADGRAGKLLINQIGQVPLHFNGMTSFTPDGVIPKLGEGFTSGFGRFWNGGIRL